MISDRKTLTEYLGYEDSDLDFMRVLNDKDNYDIDYGVNVISILQKTWVSTL